MIPNSTDFPRFEQAIQAKGKLSLEGKDYEIQDGDVVYFRFSV